MRTVLLGTDFMYNNNGNLVPIEINTSVGWAGYDKIESDEDSLDLTNLINFINTNNFTKIEYIGNITAFFNQLSSSIDIPCELHKQNSNAITIPNIDDNDETLIIRSAYDTTALVDEQYCKNKINYLNLVKDSPFGHEFAYIDDNNTLVNHITTIPDNGIHPNFILKAVLPEYDKEVYPKLYKVTTQEELNTILQNVTDEYFLMPYYYHDKNIVENHISVIRSLNLLFPPNLESIHIASYHRICENSVYNNAEYENLELKQEYREQYVTGTERSFKPKLDDNDLVEMADGSFKAAIDLQVGDVLKTIDIPNPFDVDNKDELANYKISYSELTSGTTYSTNAITHKKRVSARTQQVVINFTDGTDWYDVAPSTYLVEREGEVRFIQAQQLLAGDKFILLDTSSPDTVSFVEKIVNNIEKKLEFFNGWAIEVERAHLFLTKESGDNSSSFVAIEHNYISCYKYQLNCGACWQYGCLDCPKGRCCTFSGLWTNWGYCFYCC